MGSKINLKTGIFILLFLNLTFMLSGQNTRIINEEKAGKLSFYGDNGELVEEIAYNSYDNALQALMDRGEYNMEFDDQGMSYQSVAVIADKIAVLSDHTQSYMMPMVNLTAVYNAGGKVIYQYGGQVNILYSQSMQYLILENVIVNKNQSNEGYDFDIYIDDTFFIYTPAGKVVKEVRLDLKDKKSRNYSRLNKEETLYLTFTGSAIIILDLHTFKLFHYSLNGSNPPDFDLSYNCSFIQDFVLKDKNLHLTVKQFKESNFSEERFSYDIEVIYQYKEEYEKISF